MRIYVNKKTGVEVHSPFAITGEDWQEMTPVNPPVSKQSEGKPAEDDKPKAVSKSGRTVRNKK